jgi:TonB-dependent receptor
MSNRGREFARPASGGNTLLASTIAAILRRSVPTVALCMLAAGPVYAQDSSDSKLEEVIVTGIRGSLETSQEIKREANVFVDSVTAEDIGALPDRSVTEALQRIPGVSISRFAAGNDPDHFSVEGSGVVVRGLSFVRSELNGRDTFTANNGRELSFSDVSPELMGGVDVYKNQSAEMIEGGLAGTVNLRTRVPFDSKDQVFAATAEGSYADFAEEWKPTFSALFSDRWQTGIGEFGFLANAVNSKLATRSDGVHASNFRLRTDFVGQDLPEGTEVWAPRGAAFRSQTFERERRGVASALQWASNDGGWLATAQFLRSDSRQASTEHAVETATDLVGDAFRPVTGTQFEFGDNGVFRRGVVTDEMTGWRADQTDGTAANQRNRTPTSGMQHNNIRRDVDQQYVTSDYGFNLRWTPNDLWGFNFDYQHVDSTVENVDVGLWASFFANVAIDLTGSKPDIRLLPPSLSGAGADNAEAYFSNPANYFWRSAMDHIEDSEGQEDAVRFDVSREFEDAGWIDSVRFGVRATDRDQTTRFSAYNWGRISEVWGNSGPVWLDEPIDGIPSSEAAGPAQQGVPSSQNVAIFPFDNFMRGSVSIPGRPLYYTGNLAKNYEAAAEYIRLINAEWEGSESLAGWRPMADRTAGDVIAGTAFRPNEINDVGEDTGALYVQLNFGHEFDNGRSFSGNIGVRYVRTESESAGFLAFPVGTGLTTDAQCTEQETNPEPGQTVAPFCALSPAQRQRVRNYANGAVVPKLTSKTYDNFLPSLNLKYNLTDDQLIRFGYSQAIRRPEMGLLRNYISHAELEPVPVDPNNPDGQDVFNGYRGESGNPMLEPMRSRQFDLSWEWYFSKVGSLTIAGFYKELKDVITNGFRDETFTNNGESVTLQVRGPVNSDSTGRIKGVEFAYQQFYDFLPGLWNGIGVQANYSYIDSSGVEQTNLSAEDPNGPGVNEPVVDTSLLPLVGLSKHNANFALIYEKGPVSTRLAYNWRSEFLLTTRDVIVPFAPIMNEDTGQLDGSFFYTVNDNVKIGVQGANLLNEVTKTSQVLNDQLLTAGRSWFVNDRRYSAVMRVTF